VCILGVGGWVGGWGFVGGQGADRHRTVMNTPCASAKPDEKPPHSTTAGALWLAILALQDNILYERLPSHGVVLLTPSLVQLGDYCFGHAGRLCPSPPACPAPLTHPAVLSAPTIMGTSVMPSTLHRAAHRQQV
jgi:hypothetical protein